MIRIEVKGRMPTTNDLRNWSWRENNREKKKWMEIIGWAIKEAKVEAQIKNLPKPFMISTTAYTKSMRDADSGAAAGKYFQDTLVNMQIIKDDNPKFIRPVLYDWQKAEGEEKVVYLIQ